jgi:MCP family monocarboxylic acid transporter-like MFS transporter 10
MEMRLYARDGCRAWIVCICAAFSNILIFGCSVTFGVVFPVLLDEFKEGKAKTGS